MWTTRIRFSGRSVTEQYQPGVLHPIRTAMLSRFEAGWYRFFFLFLSLSFSFFLFSFSFFSGSFCSCFKCFFPFHYAVPEDHPINDQPDGSLPEGRFSPVFLFRFLKCVSLPFSLCSTCRPPTRIKQHSTRCRCVLQSDHHLVE